jgi:cytochrome d ubiquinol oxidase subunit I
MITFWVYVLALSILIYVLFAFGILYIYRLLRAGPARHLVLSPSTATPYRAMTVVDEPLTASTGRPYAVVSAEHAFGARN